MAVVQRSLYKLEIWMLKILPMLLAGCNLANTILSYFDIETVILSYIASVGIIPLLFMYLSSYVFRFCSYHRMFLHYIVVNNVLCYIDYTYHIPVTDREYLEIHLAIAGIFLFLILYLKSKVCKAQLEEL